MSYDRFDPEHTVENVESVYAGLREQPVVWTAENGTFWILSRYDDIKQAETRPAVFASADGVLLPAPNAGETIAALEQDAPEHTFMRGLYAEWLSPRRVADYEPLVAEVTAIYVKAFVAAGGGNFVEAVAEALPITIICHMLGLADQLVDIHRINAGIRLGNPGARDALVAFIFDQVEERSRRPKDDFLSVASSTDRRGPPVSVAELTNWAVGGIIAGHETTLVTGSSLLYELARSRELQNRLRVQPNLLPAAVDEVIRLHPPTQGFFRSIRETVVMHGVTMYAGDRVLLLFASGNRDERWFPEPSLFLLDRKSPSHLGFGWGPHRCIGAVLAQLELTVLAQEMLNHRFTLAGPVEWASLDGGLRVLPLSFG